MATFLSAPMSHQHKGLNQASMPEQQHQHIAAILSSSPAAIALSTPLHQIDMLPRIHQQCGILTKVRGACALHGIAAQQQSCPAYLAAADLPRLPLNGKVWSFNN